MTFFNQFLCFYTFCATKFLLWQAAEPSDRKSHEKAPDMTEKRMPRVKKLVKEFCPIFCFRPPKIFRQLFQYQPLKSLGFIPLP